MSTPILGLAGLALMASGALVAAFAPRHPRRQPTLERWAGSFLLGGFALVGMAVMRHVALF